MEKTLALLREQRSAALNELQQEHARLTNLRKSARASLWGRKGRNRKMLQVADRISQLALTYSELSRSIEQAEQESQTNRQPGSNGPPISWRRKLTLRDYPWDRRLELAIQAVGVLVVGASLILITIQTRSQTGTLRSNAFQAAVNHVLELDKMFLENPDVEPYFMPTRVSIPRFTKANEANSGKGYPEQAKKGEQSSDELASKVRAVAFTTLDVFDSFETQREHFVEPGDDKANEAIDKWIIDSFHDSPVLCDTLNGFKRWYPYLYDWIYTELEDTPCS